MDKKLKVLFTALEIIGCVGTMGASGFKLCGKYNELMELRNQKADIEASQLEVKEA